jgi:uncharacterized membrane protein YraQ (UPF0718 family)
MNKKLLIAWGVIFVVWMVGSFLIHGAILMADYSKLMTIMRPEAEAQKYLPIMILAHVIMAFSFVMIFSELPAAKPWLQRGVRYGVAVALLTAVPTYLIYYAVQPLPGMLVIKQIVLGSIHVIILGLVVAFLYKNQPAPAPAAAPGHTH